MGANLCIQTIHESLCEKYRPLLDRAIRKRDALPQGSQAAAAAQEEVTKCFRLLHFNGIAKARDDQVENHCSNH